MSAPLRVGVAGLGTVGAATARLLEGNRDLIAARAGRPIELVAVCARSKTKDRGVDLSNVAWHDDPVALAQSNTIDVFVELIGGDAGPAYDSVRAALSSGRPVVTANKAMLACHGTALARLSDERSAPLLFEAAVAGGIPIIKALREAASANQVRRVFGILNGTSNYILTRMEQERMSFADALSEAQELGYAEADPTFDIEGHDAAHKLAILAAIAFGTEVNFDAIYLEGISSITESDLAAAQELGYRIKLLGVATRTESGIEQRVTPAMMPLTSAMAEIHGVLNAVAIDGDFVGEVMLVGPGAGGNATASAVVADLIDVARGQSLPTFGIASVELRPHVRSQLRAHAGGYYVRLAVYDRPGAFAAIASRMAEEEISLESIVQKGPKAVGGVAPAARPVVLITHETTEACIRRALAAIEQDGHIAEPPFLIRIEKA